MDTATDTTTEKTEGDSWLDVIAEDLGFATETKKDEPEDDPKEEEPKPKETEEEPEDKALLPDPKAAKVDPISAIIDQAEKEAAEAEEKSEEKPPEEEEKSEEKKEEEPPLKVTKAPPIQRVVEQSVEAAFKKQSETKAEEEKVEEKKPDEFDGWSEEEKEQYELAKSAEEMAPDKYKGLAEATKKFKHSITEYIERAQKEDPSRTFDENDEEFMETVRKLRPAEIAKRDVRQIRDDRVAKRAVDMVRGDYDSKLEELRRENQALKAQPKIEKAAKEFASTVNDMLAKDENQHVSKFVKEANDIGWSKFEEKYPTIAPLMSQEVRRGTSLATEFTKLQEGAKVFDEKNEDHVEIAKFIEEQGKLFQEKGGDQRVRDGKTFMPRGEYARAVNAANAAAKAEDPKAKELYESVKKRWTYTNEDVLALMALDTRFRVGYHVTNEYDRIKKGAAALGIALNEESDKTQAKPAKAEKPAEKEEEEVDAKDHSSPVVTSSSQRTETKETGGEGGAFSPEEMRLLLGD